MDALQHLITDETVPKGAFIGDRIYYPMSKPEKLQIPLRKAGYKVMGDLVKDQMGYRLPTTVHSLLTALDTSPACPPAGATLVPFSPPERWIVTSLTTLSTVAKHSLFK